MTAIQRYLEPALKVLKKVGIDLTKSEDSQLVQILDDIKQVDEPRVLAIATTVRYIGNFNELVRDRVEGMNVDDRYNDITVAFTSIRDDSKKLVAQLSDGKIDLKEKVQNYWMRLRRGTTHDRFDKIKDIYLDVSADTKEQLDRETEIIGAYQDFRLALKSAEILAKEVLQTQEKLTGKAKVEFSGAADIVIKYSGSDEAEKSRLQMKREEAQRVFEQEDRKYQLIKDVAENLSNSYNVGETLVAKLKQTHDLKEQVYRRSVTFFTTNENVFTTMDAVYTSQHGLHETTQTLESMKDGANKGLEDIAELGTKLETAALKAGYGSVYNPESVKKLVDAVVAYQEESVRIIGELRVETAKNAKEIEAIVEDGKQRSRDALSKYLIGQTQAQLPAQ